MIMGQYFLLQGFYVPTGGRLAKSSCSLFKSKWLLQLLENDLSSIINLSVATPLTCILTAYSVLNGTAHLAWLSLSRHQMEQSTILLPPAQFCLLPSGSKGRFGLTLHWLPPFAKQKYYVLAYVRTVPTSFSIVVASTGLKAKAERRPSGEK